MSKIPVTVVIPVKNEAENLSFCLDKLNEFSEVLVVDSDSTDDTSKIAEQFDCELINFKWNGKFPKKRNWVLSNVNLKNEWVLFLDADEYLTPQFIAELKTAITKSNYNGYLLYYNNYFMGKLMRFGDKMRKLALFKKSCGRYERIDEDRWSHLDMEVHEHPIIKGAVGKIKSPIIHNDFKGLEHYKMKHEAYSSWEAKRFVELEKNGNIELTKRQKWKYTLLKMGVLPGAYFLGSFILNFGFLDGKKGFMLAKHKADYFRQIQNKIENLKLLNESNNNHSGL